MLQEKIQALKNWMLENQTDLLYLSSPETIAYYTGFHSHPYERILALFIPLEEDPLLFTPALEVKAAEKSPWPFRVAGYLDSENPWEVLKKELKLSSTKPIRVALEKENLSVKNFENFSALIPQATFKHNVTEFLQLEKLVKTDKEIARLIEAGHWADVALEIGFKTIKDRVTEIELVAEIEYQLKRQGVRDMSFDTLVLTGENCADPHGISGKTPVVPKDLVLFDLGVVWNGYCSDVTRTVAYRKPTDFQVEIYQIVLEAQTAARAAAKPGISCEELDAVARNVIASYGYGEYFNHRLGHGIGTTVHEFPSIVEGNPLILKEGMCFSIEPGIYIPGKVGVRIEDCVYLTEDGCESFTHTPRELTIIE